MISSIKLYFSYLSINIKSILQYKASFILMTIGEFLVSFTTFLGIFFIFERFQSIGRFTYSQVLLCFSIVLMGYSIAECFCRGFIDFSVMIKNGGFDKIMVRPRNPIIQVLGSKLDLTGIGKIIQALVMLVIAIANINLVWTVSKIITIIFMLIGGIILFFSLFMINAALCFFTTENIEFVRIFTSGAREYCKYPLEVYGKGMLRFCTFIIPYALIQYYPLLYIIDMESNFLYMFLPLGSILFFFMSLAFWKYSVKHYKSVGS